MPVVVDTPKRLLLLHWHNRPVPVPPPLEDLNEILDAVRVSTGYSADAEERP